MVSELFDLSGLLAILPIPNELSLFFSLDPDFPPETVIGRSPAASSLIMCETSGESELLFDEVLTAWLELPMDEPPSDGADGPDAEPFILGALDVEDLSKPRLMRESGRGRPSGSAEETGVSPFVSVTAGLPDEDTPAEERSVGETRSSGDSGAKVAAKIAISGAKVSLKRSERKAWVWA